MCRRFDRSVHVESDLFFRFIQGGFIAPWRPESGEQNDLIMGLVADVASGYAGAGYVTVVDGILLPDFYLPPLERQLHSAGHEVVTAILRPPLAACIDRAANRGPDSIDPAAIEKVWRGFGDMGTLEPLVIDNEAEQADETARRVLELLPGSWIRPTTE